MGNCYEKSRGRGDGKPCSSDILFTAFIIFGVCNAIFISYAAINHKTEQDDIQAQIDEISEILNRLKTPSPPLDCDDKGSCKEITALLTKLQSCEKRGSVIRLLKDQMENRKQYLKMWDNVPKPFIHVEMKNPEMKGHDLHGWNTTAAIPEQCEGLDPILTDDRGKIKVKMAGHYYVYSQVTFQCPFHHRGGRRNEFHVHSTKLLRRYPDQLMTNSYQLCGIGEEGKLKASFHSGIYKLQYNDQLLVTVEKPPSTELYVDEDYHNDDLFFGAYLL